MFHNRRDDQFDREFNLMRGLFKVVFGVALIGVLASWAATAYFVVLAADKAPAIIDAATKALERLGDS